MPLPGIFLCYGGGQALLEDRILGSFAGLRLDLLRGEGGRGSVVLLLLRASGIHGEGNRINVSAMLALWFAGVSGEIN